jgi:single-strand DNA-binding protein
VSDHITVIGNIVTDPERRQTGAGVPVANFRVASNHRRRDEATGNWVDGHTTFYSVSAYRTLAEHALASLRKGERVIVTGALRVREWESNGRQGASADLDATALGHDLLWGTSSFTRTSRAAAGGTVGAGQATPPPEQEASSHASAELASVGAAADWSAGTDAAAPWAEEGEPPF